MDAPTNEYENQIDFLYGLYALRRLKCIGNYVFKTSELKKIGGFINFPCAWGSDDSTVSVMSKNGVGIAPDVLFSFRLSGKNISTTTNSKINGLKVKARIQNLEWFYKFTSDISIDGSLLAKFRLKSYKEFYSSEWTKSIITGAEFLALIGAKESYDWLIKHGQLNGFMQKIHFWWTWLRAAKYRM